MPRELRDFLSDILEHIGNVEEFIPGTTEARFLADKAITEILRREPTLEHEITDFRDIKIARNVLAHGYFAIRPERIWSTCSESLPLLRAEVEAILASID